MNSIHPFLDPAPLTVERATHGVQCTGARAGCYRKAYKKAVFHGLPTETQDALLARYEEAQDIFEACYKALQEARIRRIQSHATYCPEWEAALAALGGGTPREARDALRALRGITVNGEALRLLNKMAYTKGKRPTALPR